MSELKNIQNQISAAALKSGSIAFNFSSPWKWASGYYMPIYNDNRLLLSDYSNRKLVFQGLELLANQHFQDIDVIAGCATGGIAPAVGLADALQKEFIYVRSSSKAHGKSQAIEGSNPENKNVLVIEDLISTGGSSIAVIEKINQAKGNVIGCLSIFNYGFEKAIDNFKEAELSPYSLINFETLLNAGKELSLLDEDEITNINTWLDSPFDWGKKMGFA